MQKLIEKTILAIFKMAHHMIVFKKRIYIKINQFLHLIVTQKIPLGM